MFDLGWQEIFIIGTVTLIVVGPKDLPVLFRRVGEFVGRRKGMAREFTSAMNDAADQSGVKDISKTISSATNPVKTGLDKVGEATKEFTNFDPLSETGKLASKRAEAAKKLHAATANRQDNNKTKKAGSNLEESEKSSSEKIIKSENKK